MKSTIEYDELMEVVSFVVFTVLLVLLFYNCLHNSKQLIWDPFRTTLDLYKKLSVHVRL
jgi:hypothetical protein